MSIESVMPSNRLILCHSLLSPSIFPSIRVFSNESVLRIRWPKYWSFSFSISPSNEHSGLISFRMDWLDLSAVQGTLKSLLHGEGNGNPLQYSCLENSMDGWRSLVGYSPWGCKESHDWAAFHFHSHFLNTMVVLIIALKTGMLDYIFSILLKYCVDKVILKNIVTKCHHKKKKRWTGWISWQSKGLSRVFSNTTVQKHQFFSAQLSSQSNSHIHTWPLD